MRPLVPTAFVLAVVAAGAVASASPSVQTVLCSSIFIQGNYFGCNVAGSPAPVSSTAPIPVRSVGPTPVRTAEPIVIAPTLAPTERPTIAPPTPKPTATPLPEPTSVPTSAGLLRADTIADSIGADSHFNYSGWPYETVPLIKQQYLASGIRYLRDSGAPWTHNGIALGLTDTPAQMEAKHKANPYAAWTELCGNEADSQIKGDWVTPLRACVARESAVAKAWGLPLVAPSLVDVSHSSMLGKLPEVDFQNTHFGTCGDNPGTTRYKSLATAAKETTAVAPAFWVTETGYSSRRTPTIDKTLFGRPCAIPDRFIAAYDVRLVFEWKLAGANKVMFYQLAQTPADVIFGGTGMLNANGTTTPQFLAIKNLIALYSDEGQNFTPTPVGITVSAPLNVHHIFAEKRDGTLLVAVWREATDIQWETQKPTNLPLEAATVSAPGYAVTALHEFQPDGSLKTAAPSMPVMLGPDAVVVELKHR